MKRTKFGIWRDDRERLMVTFKFRNSLFLNLKQLLFKMYKLKRTILNTRLFPAGSLSFVSLYMIYESCSVVSDSL